ncbi:MAG: sugar phosphate nucleotidyltransferase [Dehalococcoidia bacterium]|nr:sugar phosphate nucleotidyltransferase [Dehalococcoidia bacterium]
MEKRITQAIILAAGEGQRLKPFTKLMPKVMLPIAGKPILQYVVEALAQNGVRRVVMVVGYRKEHVQDYFASGKEFGVDIEYVIQPHQLGTAHALEQARGVADDRFLVVAGDNIISPDSIAPLVNAQSNTVLIRAQDDISKYGVVMVRDGRVKEIIEEPSKKVSSLVNTGTYALNKEVFSFIGDEVNLPAVLQKMINQGCDIMAQETRGTWLDAVYPWDILELNNLILGGISPSLGGVIEDGVTVKGLVSVGDRTVIRSNSYIVGPVVIGEGCEIGPGVCIFPSTSIGKNVFISPFSIVGNSAIGDNVTIGANSSLQDTVIAPGVIIRNHFSACSRETSVLVEDEHQRVKMGAIIGGYSDLGDNVVVEPGVVVGNHCRIKSMKVIRQNIPDGSLVI